MYCGAKSLADCIDLPTNPNGINHEQTAWSRRYIGGLNETSKCVLNPCTSICPIKLLAGTLKRPPLVLYVRKLMLD